MTVTPDLDEAVDRELGDLFSETVLPVGDKRSWENKISDKNLEVVGQKQYNGKRPSSTRNSLLENY